MSRLDDMISKMSDAIANNYDTQKDLLYIRDCLIGLRNIQNTGSCYECTKYAKCEHFPKWGDMTRFNCPFFERKEEREDDR